MSSPPASGTASPFEDDEVNFESGDEYEETIRKQRAENAALLASLELSTGGSALVDPEGSKRKRTAADVEERKKKRLSEQRIRAAEDRKKRLKAEAANGGPDLRPARTSARLRGKLPAGMEEENKRIEAEKKEMEFKRAQSKKLLHQEHKLLALLGEDEEAKKKEEALIGALQAVIAREDEEEEEKKSKASLKSSARGGLGDETDEIDTDRALAELQEEIDKMDLLAAKKVTPKRLYTAAWHPSVQRELVFTGDKEGHIGVWEPFAKKAQTGGDDDDEAAETKEDLDQVTGDDGITYTLRIPQDSSPISCLKVPPHNPTKLFSSSYNSTLRKIDLEKGVSEQVFSFSTEDDDDGGDGALLSVFDFQREGDGGATAGGDVIWCGDHRGGVVRIDLREPGGAAPGPGAGNARSRRSNGGGGGGGLNWQRWQLCEKKIGGLSINPLSPHVLSVASLDQSIHLFDTRRLSTLPQTPFIPTTYKHVDPDTLSLLQQDVLEGGAQLGWKKSKQASTSVDFSPDGSKLAAVSYDDVVKVWEMDREWLDVDAGAAAGAGAPAKKGRASTGSTKSNATPKRGGLMRYFKKEEEGEEAEDVKGASSRGNTARKSAGSGQARPADLLSSPLVIPHNNQTGKWLTLFRVRWAPTPFPGSTNHFTIGNMRRSIDLYSAEGKYLRGLYDEEWQSAVPAVCVFHPAGGVRSQIGERVMGGSASGRCVLWGRPRSGSGEEEA